VVLDAVFSVVYIVVMFIYSWQLTLVALATIPLFVHADGFGVAPLCGGNCGLKPSATPKPSPIW
jgi:multidrug efflux pump subunit AcrB